MTIGDLLTVARFDPIHLHSGKDGKLIAKSRKTLEIYSEVEVLSVYPKIDLNRDGNYARPFLFVYGDECGIREVRMSGLV